MMILKNETNDYLAMSNTVGLSADGHTFGAVFSFTGLVGAFDLKK